MLRAILFLLALAHSPLMATAQTSTYKDRNPKVEVAWEELVGKIVTVDGLAWGAYVKALITEHLVLAEEGKVYLQGAGIEEQDLNGRLLRVSGVLRKGSIKRPEIQQASLDDYYIDVLTLHRIDQVKRDQLLPSQSDWLVVGMPLDAALALVAKHHGRDYPLSLTAAKDGSTSHSFQMPLGEVILLAGKENRVLSLTRIDTGQPGKVDDKPIPLRGFELPHLRVIE